MVMGDQSRVQMCKDRNGQWQQSTDQTDESSPAPNSPNGLPARAEVTYNGNWSAELPTGQKMNITSLNLSSILNQVAKSAQKKTVGGAFHATATFNGDMVTANISGQGFTPEQLTGRIDEGVCHLSGAFDRFDGPCGRDGFSGTINGHTTRGESYSGRFETMTTQVVDIGQREQQQLAAQKAAQAAEAAAEAKLRAAPAAGPLLTKKLDGYVRTDSRGWAFNHYDAGSMTNVKIVDGTLKSGHYTLRGEYSYNGGQSGWVMASMNGPNLDCIQFWDAMVGCRALRSPEQGQQMRNAALGAFSGGGGGGGSTGPSVEEQMINRQNNERYHQEQEQQQAPPPPPVTPIGGDSGLYGGDHSCC